MRNLDQHEIEAVNGGTSLQEAHGEGMDAANQSKDDGGNLLDQAGAYVSGFLGAFGGGDD